MDDYSGSFNIFEAKHPESVDPPWFQELVRRALEREMRRLTKCGIDQDAAFESAMWYVFDLRNNLTDLYQAGSAGEDLC